MEYSIIIPVYNEEDNIDVCHESVFSFFNKLGVEFEIIYVNDGSSDGSLLLLKEIEKQCSQVRVISLLTRMGESAASFFGFQNAHGVWLVTIDADLQNTPDQLQHFFPYQRDFDMVVGSRIGRADFLLKRISSRMANAVRRIVLGDDFEDMGCTFRLFKRKIIGQVPAFVNFHRFLPYLAQKAGFKVAVVAVDHYPRKHGRSKYGFWGRLLPGFFDLLGVLWLSRRMIKVDR